MGPRVVQPRGVARSMLAMQSVAEERERATRTELAGERAHRVVDAFGDRWIVVETTVVLQRAQSRREPLDCQLSMLRIEGRPRVLVRQCPLGLRELVPKAAAIQRSGRLCPRLGAELLERAQRGSQIGLGARLWSCASAPELRLQVGQHARVQVERRLVEQRLGLRRHGFDRG